MFLRLPAREAAKHSLQRLARTPRIVLVAAACGRRRLHRRRRLHHVARAVRRAYERNSVKFGVRVGQGNLSAAAPAGVAVLLFVAGVAIGTIAAELAARRRVESIAAAVLAIQAALIATFMLYGRTVIRGHQVIDHTLSGFYVLAALGVLSMGIQTSALRQFGGRTISTTYVTGVLTSITQELTNYLFWLLDGHSRDKRHSFLSRVLDLDSRADSRRRATLLASVFLTYVAGGVLGSFCDGRLRLWSLLLTLAALVALIAIDLRRPLELAIHGH